MFPPLINYSENPESFFRRAYLHPDETSLVALCAEGHMSIHINGKDLVLEKHQMLFIGPHYELGDFSYTRDSRFLLISMQDDEKAKLVHFCMREDPNWWDTDRYLLSNPVFLLSDEQMEICEMYGRLLRTYAEKEEESDSRIVHSLLECIALDVLNWVKSQMPMERDIPLQGRTSLLFRRFLQLVQQDKGKKREVQYYAEKLAVTPKYLTTVSQQFSGKAAYELINDSTIQEIRRLIVQTDLSSKEISERLGFITPSFFCKYVKREIGMSVKEYRIKHRK